MVSPYVVFVPVDFALFRWGVDCILFGIFNVFPRWHRKGGDVLKHASVDGDFAIKKVFHGVIHMFSDEFLLGINLSICC